MSMFAQMAALIALALMAAHIVGYFLILDQQQRANLIQASEPGVKRFAQVIGAFSHDTTTNADIALARASDFNHRFSLSDTSRVADRRVRRDRDLESHIQRTLMHENIQVRRIEAGITERDSRLWFEPPPGMRIGPGWRPRWAPGLAPGSLQAANPQIADPQANSPQASSLQVGDAGPTPNWQTDGAPHFPLGPRGLPGGHAPHDLNVREAVISAELANGRWINVETFWHVPPPDFVPRVIAAEILLYCAILAAALFLAGRIARPLKTLADTSSQVGSPGPAPNITVQGPAEVRAAIGSFNVMSARVAALLREKDEMLGAIGHDLRTPIASLRLRAEGIVNPIERQRFITTLDDMRQLLDDALDMARIGQSSEPSRHVDLGALADSLVEDYRSQGDNVTFAESVRAPVFCKPALTRRMLRNLIDNALKFGRRAIVSVEVKDAGVRLTIADEGPGLPENELTRMLEPFVRLETSRNRNTGGAGLGLAIAARIAAAEGATLTLANRPDQAGLLAVVAWQQAPKNVVLQLLRPRKNGDAACAPVRP